MSDTATLAFEIGTEEIPAFDLKRATEQLAELVPAALDAVRIPHGEEGQVTAQALSAYDALGLPPLEAFSKVYVAGAQFYFSLCLVTKGLAFSFSRTPPGP